MTNYETTWWEPAGWQTPWQETQPGSGVQTRRTVFRCLATGEQRESPALPIGAVFAVSDNEFPAIQRTPFHNNWPPCGYDGFSIACVCIGNAGPDSRHHWYIDYRASNCTLPDDREHRCWVRHGSIGERITVDKLGKTCAAGAGSFFMDGQRWHGFLRDGVMVKG